MNLNSLVMTKVRPTVVFDASNADHRYHAYMLLKNRTLKDCPYIFALLNCEDNVYNMVMKELSMYYTAQEFAVAEKQQGDLGIDKPAD
jgi:hypothetical protein